jgi:hypothetical protein
MVAADISAIGSRSGSSIPQFVCQHGAREGLPGEVAIGHETGEGPLDERQAGRRRAEGREPLEQLVAPHPRVEVGGESGHGAAVELELATWVASGREEQHRPPKRAVQLVFGELELGARDERDRHEPLRLRTAGQHLFDLAQNGAHTPNDTITRMKEVLADIERWRSRGERVALATVIATRRSAPRPIGSKFAVSERGEMAGSISGGCVEGDVAERAKEVLAGAEPVLLTYGIADEQAFEVGLPCGGEIDVWLEQVQ